MSVCYILRSFCYTTLTNFKYYSTCLYISIDPSYVGYTLRNLPQAAMNNITIASQQVSQQGNTLVNAITTSVNNVTGVGYNPPLYNRYDNTKILHFSIH